MIYKLSFSDINQANRQEQSYMKAISALWCVSKKTDYRKIIITLVSHFENQNTGGI